MNCSWLALAGGVLLCYLTGCSLGSNVGAVLLSGAYHPLTTAVPARARGWQLMCLRRCVRVGRPALPQGWCSLALPRCAASVCCGCARPSRYDIAISICAGRGAAAATLPDGLAQSCSSDGLRCGTVWVCLKASSWCYK